MKANKSQRFSHTWVLNEADGLPAQYRGQMFAVEPLQGRVMLSDDQAGSLVVRDQRSRPGRQQ